MAAISSAFTQTCPGAPVQQSPQRVHLKRRPSSYQGSFMKLAPNAFDLNPARPVDQCDSADSLIHFFAGKSRYMLSASAMAVMLPGLVCRVPANALNDFLASSR